MSFIFHHRTAVDTTKNRSNKIYHRVGVPYQNWGELHFKWLVTKDNKLLVLLLSVLVMYFLLTWPISSCEWENYVVRINHTSACPIILVMWNENDLYKIHLCFISFTHPPNFSILETKVKENENISFSHLNNWQVIDFWVGCEGGILFQIKFDIQNIMLI